MPQGRLRCAEQKHGQGRKGPEGCVSGPGKKKCRGCRLVDRLAVRGNEACAGGGARLVWLPSRVLPASFIARSV